MIRSELSVASQLRLYFFRINATFVLEVKQCGMGKKSPFSPPEAGAFGQLNFFSIVSLRRKIFRENIKPCGRVDAPELNGQ